MPDKTDNLPAAKKSRRFASRLTVRPRVLIAGIVSGGTMIAFPSATGVAVIYVACALATMGMMAWAGAVALAAAAALVLVPPILTVIAILIIRAMVRGIIRLAWPTVAMPDDTQAGPAAIADADNAADPAPINASNALGESLDRWETDGGSPDARQRISKRRVRFFNHKRQRVRVAPV